jgi:hypothetical protein
VEVPLGRRDARVAHRRLHGGEVEPAGDQLGAVRRAATACTALLSTVQSAATRFVDATAIATATPEALER